MIDLATQLASVGSTQHTGPTLLHLCPSNCASSLPCSILAFYDLPIHRQEHRIYCNMSSSSNTQAEPSYALVPPKYASNTSTSSNASTWHPVYAGVHDTMRHGTANVLHQVSTASHHPVQNRLENWDATRDNLKLTMQRNVHGLGAPAHILMERKIASYVSLYPPPLPPKSNKEWFD